MKVSYVLARLSQHDILGIIQEFIKVDGLEIENIEIKDIITIKGKFTKKVSVNFSVTIGVGAVNSDEIVIKILKVKVGILRIAISLIQLIFKKLLASLEPYGVIIKDKHIVINLDKIQSLIPVTTFSIKSVMVKDSFIEIEGENININLEKQYKSIEVINEEFNNEKYQKKLELDDTYVKVRQVVSENIPEKIKGVSSYILLIPDFIALIIRLFKDKRVGIKEKVFLGSIVTYLLLPMDIIPDFVFGIGSIDDIYIIFYALEKIVKSVPKEVILDNWEGDPEVILNSSKIIKDVFDVLGVKNSKTLFKSLIKKILIKKRKKEIGVK
ncbi:MAG: YkvA family protein [Clostridiaceae bacterium]